MAKASPRSKRATTAPGSDGGAVLSIGARLRTARLEQGLTLQQLAERVGLTKGFISLLERGDASASVGSLMKLCAGLGITMGSLFEALEPAVPDVVRRGEARSASLGGDGVAAQVVTPADERRFSLVRCRLEPLAATGVELYAHAGDVGLAHVVSGVLEAQSENGSVLLKRGDSLRYSPTTLHSWRNPSPHNSTLVLFVDLPSSV
jgi:transcriptional regulator with XRE-family HTH domain